MTTVPSSPPSSANQFDFLIRCKWNQLRANAGWHRGGRASLLELVAIPLGPFTGVKAKRHDHAAPMEKAVRPDRQAGRHWGVCTCNLENVLLQIKTIQQRGPLWTPNGRVCVFFFSSGARLHYIVTVIFHYRCSIGFGVVNASFNHLLDPYTSTPLTLIISFSVCVYKTVPKPNLRHSTASKWVFVFC